jgi:hypothetical protein
MADTDGNMSIGDLQDRLATGDAAWEAGESYHWNLTLDQKRLRLGAVPPTHPRQLPPQAIPLRSTGGPPAASTT